MDPCFHQVFLYPQWVFSEFNPGVCTKIFSVLVRTKTQAAPDTRCKISRLIIMPPSSQRLCIHFPTGAYGKISHPYFIFIPFIVRPLHCRLFWLLFHLVFWWHDFFLLWPNHSQRCHAACGLMTVHLLSAHNLTFEPMQFLATLQTKNCMHNSNRLNSASIELHVCMMGGDWQPLQCAERTQIFNLCKFTQHPFLKGYGCLQQHCQGYVVGISFQRPSRPLLVLILP